MFVVIVILAFFVGEAGNYDFQLKTVIFWLVGVESRGSHTKTPSEHTLTGFFHKLARKLPARFLAMRMKSVCNASARHIFLRAIVPRFIPLIFGHEF